MAHVLLIHSDHADESTTFTDSSTQSHSITVDNDTQHDTAQKVFGASSVLFDGTGDRLRIADHASLELGSGDFCIDLRFRIDDYTPGTKPTLIGKWNKDTNNKSYLFRYDSDDNQVDFFYSTDGSTSLWFNFNFTATLDTWYHVALTRDGSNLRCFIDGTQIGSTENIGSSTFYNGSNELMVGVYVGTGGAYSQHLKGWIDEVAIRTGEAIWTSNFTPPSSAYSLDETVTSLPFESVSSLSSSLAIGVAASAFESVSALSIDQAIVATQVSCTPFSSANTLDGALNIGISAAVFQSVGELSALIPETTSVTVEAFSSVSSLDAGQVVLSNIINCLPFISTGELSVSFTGLMIGEIVNLQSSLQRTVSEESLLGTTKTLTSTIGLEEI